MPRRFISPADREIYFQIYGNDLQGSFKYQAVYKTAGVSVGATYSSYTVFSKLCLTYHLWFQGYA